MSTCRDKFLITKNRVRLIWHSILRHLFCWMVFFQWKFVKKRNICLCGIKNRDHILVCKLHMQIFGLVDVSKSTLVLTWNQVRNLSLSWGVYATWPRQNLHCGVAKPSMNLSYSGEFVLSCVSTDGLSSSGSSGRVGGAEKHEIYADAFGGHLFYDLFSQGQGGPWHPRPPLDPLLLSVSISTLYSHSQPNSPW